MKSIVRFCCALAISVIALWALSGCCFEPSTQAQTAGRKPVLWLIGDSTVNTPTRGQLGWGAALPEFFNPTKISIENKARGGRSSRT